MLGGEHPRYPFKMLGADLQGFRLRVRRLRGLAVYFVNKDEEVTMLDLRVAGLVPVRPRGDYSHYFEQLFNALQEIVRPSSGGRLRKLVLRLRTSARSRGAGPLVLALAIVSGRKVLSVALGSTVHGALFTIDERLRNAGWQRAFYMEVKPTRVQHTVQ